MNKDYLKELFAKYLQEDIGDGDHSSLSTIPQNKIGICQLLIKQNGIIAGVDIVEELFKYVYPDSVFTKFINDGDFIKVNDIVFTIEMPVVKLLSTERLSLNILQRMSGIASETYKYVEILKGTNTKLLDTRKTTPGFRFFEKEAVRIGGGVNHRFGLYDMIMLKDNHIDFAGGIKNAIAKANNYIKSLNKELKIEIEARTIDDIKLIMEIGGVDRIMLDNFDIINTKKAIEIINGMYEIESSGGISYQNIREYAECGVDFISVGALTHQVKSLDMSLKALF